MTGKPTAKVFFACYIGVWSFCVLAFAPQAHNPLHAVIAINLVGILINVIGTAVIIMTGWAPWRDD